MLIADRKKKESITDYIIYIYQTEDLIRQLNFDLHKLDQYAVSHYGYAGEERTESKAWYKWIITEMKNQHLEERGHIDQTHELIKSLASLSMELLRVDREYRLLYDNAKLFIQKNLEGTTGSITAPICTCLNALYETNLQKLRGQTPSIDHENLLACQEVTAYLSFKYKQRKSVQTT